MQNSNLEAIKAIAIILGVLWFAVAMVRSLVAWLFTKSFMKATERDYSGKWIYN